MALRSCLYNVAVTRYTALLSRSTAVLCAVCGAFECLISLLRATPLSFGYFCFSQPIGLRENGWSVGQ